LQDLSNSLGAGRGRHSQHQRQHQKPPVMQCPPVFCGRILSFKDDGPTFPR
jgi:hypothetical protein